MRQTLYSTRVVYHDSDAMVGALKAKAQREGLTFAEIMRRAARREALEPA